MHTRFEHSLGAMHMANKIFDGIVNNSESFLSSEYGFNKDGLARHSFLIRIAALLHDIGHTPFSHAGEDLYPEIDGSGRRYRHEHYSAAIIKKYFSDIIKNHPLNNNYSITIDDIASLIEGDPASGPLLIWKEIISGQIDCDRMDYLLRDSLHLGVGYGRYDWERLVNTLQVVRNEEKGPRIGIAEGGWHAAEALILARYFMFTQVYYHKTRISYDYHFRQAMAEILPGGLFPPPTDDGIESYVGWDDWRVLGALSAGKGGEHGLRLRERNHFRRVRSTTETPSEYELDQVDIWKDKLGELLKATDYADKSWYKIGNTDIPVQSESNKPGPVPLSKLSSFVARMQPIKQVSLYVQKEDMAEANQKLANV
jgi:hypothetical protein